MSHPNLVRVFVTRHPCREVNLSRASPIFPSDFCRPSATVVLTTTKLSAKEGIPLTAKMNFLSRPIRGTNRPFILENEKLTQIAWAEEFQRLTYARRVTSSTPINTKTTPIPRLNVTGWAGKFIHAKWSIRTEDASCPATTAAINAAAPSLGVNAAPDKTISAPRGPPIQFHHGVARNIAAEGAAGRIASITIKAVTIVPQIEKKVAQRVSFKKVRNEEFAAA